MSTITPTVVNNQSSRAEFIALSSTIFFLPLFEAPKNIAVVLYIFFWALRCIKSNDWGGAWSVWESLASLLAIGAALSIPFGLFESTKGMTAIGDILSYLLVFIAVRRTDFSTQQITNLFFIAITSTLITLLLGYYEHYLLHKTEHLQLHSVGHVNHSAIYLALSIIICTEIIISRGFKNANILLAVLISVLLFFWTSLFIMSARGAIIPLLVYFAFLILIRSNSWRTVTVMTVAFSSVLLITLWQFPGIINKATGNMSNANYSSKRVELAHTATLAAREAPLFGVGLNNFGKITPETTDAWQKDTPLYQQDQLFYTSHAHNLYFNTLAERGLVGFIPFIAILLLLGTTLWKYKPSCGVTTEALTFAIALGAFIMITLGGIFNTTLHHEHGMLSMMLIGVWLSTKRQINPP